MLPAYGRMGSSSRLPRESPDRISDVVPKKANRFTASRSPELLP